MASPARWRRRRRASASTTSVARSTRSPRSATIAGSSSSTGRRSASASRRSSASSQIASRPRRPGPVVDPVDRLLGGEEQRPRPERGEADDHDGEDDAPAGRGGITGGGGGDVDAVDARPDANSPAVNRSSRRHESTAIEHCSVGTDRPTVSASSAREPGHRLIASQVRMHPRPFVVAVSGAAVFALGTVASSAAIRWVIDDVIVPRFDEGSVAAGHRADRRRPDHRHRPGARRRRRRAPHLGRQDPVAGGRIAESMA